MRFKFLTEKFNIVPCSIKTFYIYWNLEGFMSHFCCIEFSIHFIGIFRFFLSYHLIKILCVTQEYQHFMPKAVSVFAGRRCMSVMLFDRTTNKLCLCLSATRRYFAARTKRVFYSLYIQGEMQMETNIYFAKGF